jgi:hypothetical protein
MAATGTTADLGLAEVYRDLHAPVIEPTVGTGIAALVSAARGWLPGQRAEPRRDRARRLPMRAGRNVAHISGAI